MNKALLLLGGSGSRVSGNIPKQYLLLQEDRPMFFYPLKSISESELIDEIYLVVDRDHIDYVKDYVIDNGFLKVKRIVCGGSTRQESVFNGLEAFKRNNTDDEDIILIHDSARALVSTKLIDECIKASKSFDAVTTMLNMADTVVEKKTNYIYNIVNRESLKIIQTPQSFKFKTIYGAHLFANERQHFATDDAGLVLFKNQPVHMVFGQKLNFKVTTDEDVLMVKAIVNTSTNS